MQNQSSLVQSLGESLLTEATSALFTLPSYCSSDLFVYVNGHLTHFVVGRLMSHQYLRSIVGTAAMIGPQWSWHSPQLTSMG